ncbi:hypothetical protein FAGKG844_170030 [Frankia sp. AgKG'84/4]
MTASAWSHAGRARGSGGRVNVDATPGHTRSLQYGNVASVRDVAQLGSAPDWGSGGRRFKSCRPDNEIAPLGRSRRRGLSHFMDTLWTLEWIMKNMGFA